MLLEGSHRAVGSLCHEIALVDSVLLCLIESV